VVTGWQLFKGLPEAELRRLVSISRRRRFARNEVVFHRSDPADTLHLVSRGRFAARITTQLGSTTIYTLHGPGEAFGELALVEEEAVRSTTVVALEPSETYAVHRDDFHGLRARYPVVNEVLVLLLAERLRRANERLLETLFAPAETRVLRCVRDLSDLYGGEPGAAIPLTQEDIAGLSGTSRATVNRVLRIEAKQGILELRRGKTIVLDPAALARHAQAPAL